jgi:hypothetical protein
MGRVFLQVLAAIALLAGIGGCGKVSLSPSTPGAHAWRAVAEKSCLANGFVNASAYVQPASPINGKGACGVYQPFNVTAALDGQVVLQPSATLDCNMTAALEHWFATVVQPAAEQRFGTQVVGARVLSSYSCRTRNSERGAKLSEHAFGNAIDIAEFSLADGRTVAVKSGWRSAGAERAFWHDVHAGACDTFYTVLGPNADRHHADHLHLDLARHNRRGNNRYCR